MKNYYLLFNEKTNRLVIDSCKSLPGYVVQRHTKASCWIEAKKLLGFELTALQQEMLNEKNNSHQAGRRFVRHLKDAGAELRTPDSELSDGFETGEDSGVSLQHLLCG